MKKQISNILDHTIQGFILCSRLKMVTNCFSSVIFCYHLYFSLDSCHLEVNVFPHSLMGWYYALSSNRLAQNTSDASSMPPVHTWTLCFLRSCPAWTWTHLAILQEVGGIWLCHHHHCPAYSHHRSEAELPSWLTAGCRPLRQEKPLPNRIMGWTYLRI